MSSSACLLATYFPEAGGDPSWQFNSPHEVVQRHTGHDLAVKIFSSGFVEIVGWREELVEKGFFHSLYGFKWQQRILEDLRVLVILAPF